MSAAKMKLREKKMRNQPVNIQYPSSPLTEESSTQNGGDTPVTGTVPSPFMCHCLCFCSCDALCALLNTTHSLYDFVSSCWCTVTISQGQQMSVCIRSITTIHHWLCMSLWFNQLYQRVVEDVINNNTFCIQDTVRVSSKFTVLLIQTLDPFRVELTVGP